MPAVSSNLGFPRIAANRELKTALESYWKGKIDESELIKRAKQIEKQSWIWQKEAGIDLIPVGDFALYDQVLDAVELFGAVPQRYQEIEWISPIERYFAMARGISKYGGVSAMEMTKWFNTNYHYLVPEWSEDQAFELNAEKLIDQIQRAKQLGITPKPVVIGPVTLIALGKAKSSDCSLEKTFQELLPIYVELFQKLEELGVKHVQLDEPCLNVELTPTQRKWIQESCEALHAAAPNIEINLASYFDGLDENLELVFSLPVQVVHLDLVTAPDQLVQALKIISDDKTLSLGVVNGRNIWTANLDQAIAQVQQAVNQLGKDRVQIGPSCSLLHCPIDVSSETAIDEEIKPWLAFAKQKLDEIALITKAVNEGQDSVAELLKQNRTILESRSTSALVVAEAVRQRVSQVDEAMYARNTSFVERYRQQQQHLKLPILPTTTIGSFPQTREVRKARADFRNQRITEEQYQEFLEEQTADCIRKQEEIGLDVLVHGEFERNDMVEYFGEKLAGFTETSNGWVQSYGSRCVKPPVIYGDVHRPKPMTVQWTEFAQNQTEKPVKGMLTGPVTILCWSFVRDDIPRSETCKQIALAIRDEVQDLEAAGIQLIQIDEPAIREGLPLKQADWDAYLKWAVDCFRLSSSGVKDTTQIHTHMCYSEFNDIFQAIADLDADVISIETSRSQMELLTGFVEFNYPNAIGPGVYDIHSPRVPTHQEVTDLLKQAIQVLPIERLWVNPDCGLKTRGWKEVLAALKVMVSASQELREESLVR
ncbi:MAG: 5-methyltetrahydropteroyltriglutamate--homocysteine S-methyltransferase [Blastopirellula sp.]|nr:MAG: 5-methyltetrahydropteroyltriglutamate--homocysteine S-methyltransferase [Blastopirellula sp.]